MRYKLAVREQTRSGKAIKGPVPRGHTTDHIVPVSFGFKHDIPPILMGSPENIEYVPFQENLAKGARVTADAVVILTRWGYDDLAWVMKERLKR